MALIYDDNDDDNRDNSNNTTQQPVACSATLATPVSDV
jgi:hypothetical protein